ncbi:MAG: orotidine-5'-phosphate decarboxylase, partial [Planctomycetales bacterium]|nr:orotidine-5'-phosphate decarboxylase [Planctomycetales bacterium]
MQLSDNFGDRLAAAVQRCGTATLVGLDPRLEQLPAPLAPQSASCQDVAEAFYVFCKEIIDVVAPLVPAVKPQAAFFEQYGAPGMHALARVIDYARANGLLVILDGKRNDIGSTATAYAEGWLGRPGESAWGADALTVSPYLGDDSLTPFVTIACERGAGLFVLVKTSNPGGRMLQDLTVEGKSIYQRVGEHVEQLSLAHV